jgi:hypothetical protein
MKAPSDLDPDIRTVLEIAQHCGEILARLPLAVVRGYLRQAISDSGDTHWASRALNMVIAAEAFDLAGAELAAEEARTVERPPSAAMPIAIDTYPDDALPSS